MLTLVQSFSITRFRFRFLFRPRRRHSERKIGKITVVSGIRRMCTLPIWKKDFFLWMIKNRYQILFFFEITMSRLKLLGLGKISHYRSKILCCLILVDDVCCLINDTDNDNSMCHYERIAIPAQYKRGMQSFLSVHRTADSNLGVFTWDSGLSHL